MKRSTILASALLSLFALAAHATPGGEPNNSGCSGVGNANSPCAGSGGAGAAQASARANASAIAAQRQAQRQQQAQRQVATGGNANAAGGASTVTGLTGISGGQFGGTGGSIGNVMAGGVDLAGARIGSDVNVERSAPAIYGATPTQGGIGTCPKPGFGIGGSGPNGGGFINATFGTDTTCRVGQALSLISMNPTLFTAEDRLKVSCKQEDIAETPTCRALVHREEEAARAESILNGEPVTKRHVTASASLDLLP